MDPRGAPGSQAPGALEPKLYAGSIHVSHHVTSFLLLITVVYNPVGTSGRASAPPESPPPGTPFPEKSSDS